MDKNLYNFSVTWHNQKEQYLGLCAEFSFLSYLANTDLEAYQGIWRLVCDFEEHNDQLLDEQEFDKWRAANIQVKAIDTRVAVTYKHLLT